ncbi:hypothetical protein, partial [Carnobacterium sp.]
MGNKKKPSKNGWIRKVDNVSLEEANSS